MNQLSISFEPVRARKRDPETSQRAASKVERFASGHFAKILDAMDSLRLPSSYRDIAERANLEPVAVARRMNELERAGLVRRAGEFGGFTQWESAP